MAKYKIIGNMTGNSMDAIDLVLTEFDGDKITDIATYSKPYDATMQQRMANLRRQAYNKTAAEIRQLPEFQSLHNDYITQIATCINNLCRQNNIDKNTISAIGFHGKTLDHNPPSKARSENTQPYTLQIGSGQMLADLTQIPVVYDFRSDFIMAGFEGAPLVAPHNAHIAANIGNGCYYNGGNTANFALIQNGIAQISADAGPFNEYTDAFIRQYTDYAYDKNGMFGRKGQLNQQLLQKIYDCGRRFYETPLPKSGDPAYYHQDEIFAYSKKNNIPFNDAVHTFEYAAAYIAALALTLVPNNIPFPSHYVLFGGGWKNPIVYQSFAQLLQGYGYILPEHAHAFALLQKRITQPVKINLSTFGDYMEARLMADLARFRLENKPWPLPETIAAAQNIVCGIIATPKPRQKSYTDCLSRAAKGW